MFEETIKNIFPQDSEKREEARRRLNDLAMPHWALGSLMDLAVDLAGMKASLQPAVERKAIVTMAGDHGVVQEGVSKYPSEVTPQMMLNFVHGGAGINALAKQAGADVFIVDMGVNCDLTKMAEDGLIINKKIGLGTANIAQGPAMSRAMAQKAIEYGIEIAEMLKPKYDIVGTGDMGIGNTTPSTAIAAVFTGKEVKELTGRGTGLNDDQLRHKIGVIEKSLSVNKPNKQDGFDVLAKVGGFEIGGIAGLIIGAAAHKMPVVVDGFISAAGALIANSLEPFVRDYLIFSHKSAEPGHMAMLEYLGCKKALLDLNFRLGEGTGGAVAMNLVEAAAAILNEVKTFEEAAVAGADK